MDCASRGLRPSALLKHTLWWNGPVSLRDLIDPWSVNDSSVEVPMDANMEERRNLLVVANVSVQPIWDLRTKFSNLNRLLRVTAYCLRFINNCRHPKVDGSITAIKLDTALRHWIKATQVIHFYKEIDSFQNGDELPKDSEVIRFTPFLDNFGVMT